MREWIYHENICFESERYNEILLKFSPWSGHREFIYDFVYSYIPKTIVELGSFLGASSFAIAQSIKDHNLSSKLYCIDTWEGDTLTSHDYKELTIYDSFKNIRNILFSDQITMIKKYFDDALSDFEDHSIDLLHIDGSHEYKDVKNDFESWLIKMKHDGIIMFHDIMDDYVLGKQMGSHIFWSELKRKYLYTFEFPQSFGLGILFLEEKTYLDFTLQVDKNHYINAYFRETNRFKDKIREDYFHNLSLEQHINQLQKEKRTVESILSDYEKNVLGKDRYIAQLQEEKKILEDTNEKYRETVSGKDGYITRLQEEKDSYIVQLQAEKKMLEDTNEKYRETVSGKDGYIVQLQEEKRILENIIEDYKRDILAKDECIATLKNDVDNKNRINYELSKQLNILESFLNSNYILRRLKERYERKNN